jgi:hypothetical protein
MSDLRKCMHEGDLVLQHFIYCGAMRSDELVATTYIALGLYSLHRCRANVVLPSKDSLTTRMA